MENRFRLFYLLLVLAVSKFALASPTTDLAWQHIHKKDFNSAETVLSTWLKENPHDRNARFLYARTLSWNTHYQRALDEYNRLIESQADNTDYLTGKATVLNWQNDKAAAITVLDLIRNISPGNKPAWELELSITNSEERFNKKHQTLRHEYFLQFLEHYQPPTRIKPPIKKKSYLLVARTYEKLDINSENWESSLVELGTEIKTVNVNASIENSQRFGFSDNQFRIGATTPVTTNINMKSALTTSSDNSLYAKWSFSAGAESKMNTINSLTYQWIHRQYENDSVDTNSIRFSRYMGRFLPSVTGNITAINNNDITLSYSASLSWFIDDNNFVRASASQGKEGEYINNALKIHNIEFIGIDGRWNFMPDWNLVYAIGHQKQGTVYIKDGIFFGLQYRF